MGETDRRTTRGLRVRACPTDGSILGAHTARGDGTFECPRCRGVWEAFEVIR